MAQSIYSRLKTTETRLMCALRCSRARSCKENMERGKKKCTQNHGEWSRVDRRCGGGEKSIINSNKDLCELERRSVFFPFIFRQERWSGIWWGVGMDWRKYTYIDMELVCTNDDDDDHVHVAGWRGRCHRFSDCW